MKTVVKVLKILVIVALIAVIPVLIFVRPKSPDRIEGVVFEKNEMPVFANTLSVDPYDLPTTEEGKIELAAQLYDIANQNTKKLDKWALLISYNTDIDIDFMIKLSIPVYGYRYQLKNGTEYYSTEYALPQGNAETLAGWFAKESSMFAMRGYTDVAKMDYMYSQKCYSPAFDTDEEGNLIVESDFSEGNMVPQSKWKSEQKTPIFCESQPEPYYVANRPMTKTNILSADIEYKKSKEGNFYRIVIELDTDKEETWKNTIDELRAGAGEDARYDKMVETLEIWENGYYKSFKSLDNCSAIGGRMQFAFDFDTYFFYDEAHLDPAGYDNFTEAKELALAYNASR